MNVNGKLKHSGLSEYEVTVRILAPNKNLARKLAKHAFWEAHHRWKIGRKDRLKRQGNSEASLQRDLEIELALIGAEDSITHKCVRPVPE